jgi:cytochrome c biogenesis protein CcmG, thiol:disulfide interchange protein DsbE
MFVLRGTLVLFTASALLAQSPFQAPSPAVSDTLVFRSPLPDFEARDLAGKTWRLADLKGRLTVISIWAVFCLPCRQELPAVQALSEEARANGKIGMLTFSLDRDPGLVRSYMREKGYTFPVIVHPDLEQNLFPAEGGIPKSWVVDRQGRRSEPFRSWTFGRVVLEVEKIARAD